MSITKYPTHKSYQEGHPAPSICVYCLGGGGKTTIAGSMCLPPLNYRVLFCNTEDKDLPGDLDAAIYAAGGEVYRVTSPTDLHEVQREVAGTKRFDAVVFDGWTIGHRNRLIERMAVPTAAGHQADGRKVHYELELAMFTAHRSLRQAGFPILSTALETWRPTIIHRDREGAVQLESLIPESERYYTMDLPNKLQGRWPAVFEVMGRVHLQVPGRATDPDVVRYIQLSPVPKKEDCKTEYEAHKPGLVIPAGTNGAFLLLYPWLLKSGRITPEQQVYYDEYKEKIKQWQPPTRPQ